MAFCGFTAMSQQCDIAFGVYFEEASPEMTEQNKAYLKNVINRAMTQSNGLGNLEDSRFCIVVATDAVDEHIIAGAPAKTVLNLDLTFYVGDMVDGKLLSSWTTRVNGVGNSAGRAFQNAITKIKPQNRELGAFAAKARDEVIGYYDRNYKNIIKKADAEVALRHYDAALYRLMSVPECCAGYDEVVVKVKEAYKLYIDYKCNENLAQARAAWMSGFTSENASIAGVFLSEIYPDAACYTEAVALMNEIKGHMGEEWKFRLKRWDDLVSIEKQRMGYAREIALAYAQNQPQHIIRFPF